MRCWLIQTKNLCYMTVFDDFPNLFVYPDNGCEMITFGMDK